MLSTRIRVALTIVGIFVVFATARTSAQYWLSNLHRDPDVESYELTMETLRTYMAVQRAIASDPEAASRIDGEFKKLSTSKSKVTVAEMAALLDQEPHVRNGLAKAGMTSREYLLVSGAVFNAGMDMAMPERDASPRSAAQKANVTLLEKNHAEWKNMQQEILDLTTQDESKLKQ